MACRNNLINFWEDRTEKGFIWGESDCLRVAMDWSVIMGHKDHFAPYRGTYKNALEAAQELRKAGYGTIEKYLDANFEVIDSPKEGDLGLLCNGKTIGICTFNSVMFYDQLGMYPVSYKDCKKFYRIVNG